MASTVTAEPCTSMSERLSRPLLDHGSGADAISILHYENEVPSFVGAEMSRLYESLYSSLTQLRLDSGLDKVSTYVVRRGSEIVTVFLYRKEGRLLKVMNEVIRIAHDDIGRFADYVFATFNEVQVISFCAIQTDVSRLRYSNQRLDYLEDIVATLPGDADEYLANLGKKTRSNLRRYLKMIKQDFPSFRFDAYENGAVEEEHIREIMAMYGRKMAVKNKSFVILEVEIQRLIQLATANGLVGVVTIDGRVCAGTIACRVGDNFFLRILTHDADFNKYSLGTLCCYLTIAESIRRGAREFHFLWGESEYKYLLSGVRRDLDYVAVFRSRLQLLLNADLAMKAGLRFVKRKAARWLQRARKQDNFSARLAVKTLNLLRSVQAAKLAVLGLCTSELGCRLEAWTLTTHSASSGILG
ncbi:hypothetical protein BH11PSE11_BH11PSE11_30370 [soil metagenome]